MKSVYIKISLSLSFLMISSVLWACPLPSLPFRELVSQSDLIVGIQLNQLDLTKKRERYNFHQIIKGAHPNNYIEERMPWVLANYERLSKDAIYAIAFLTDFSEDGKPSNYTPDARNAILFFNSMEEVAFAIKRLDKIYAIQQHKNLAQHDQESFNWLLDNLEPFPTDVKPEQFMLVDHHYWYNDAIWDLSRWRSDFKAKVYDRYGRKQPYREKRGGNLSVLSEEGKARCLSIYQKQAHHPTAFSSLILRLGFEHIYPSILKEMHDALALSHNSSWTIARYQDLLLPLTLSKEDQRYFAKLILFNYKVKFIPEHKQDPTDYFYEKFSELDYLDKVIQQQHFSQLVLDWKAYLKEHEYGTVYDLNILEGLVAEAEKHLNMCNDPRINQLTGKRKLWTCVNESAFSTAEAFEEGSIETTIYPNPSNGNFTIKLKLEKEAVVQLTLESLDGQQIIQQELESKRFENERFHFQEELSLEGLATGIYLLTIRQHNKVFVEKVMIQ